MTEASGSTAIAGRADVPGSIAVRVAHRIVNVAVGVTVGAAALLIVFVLFGTVTQSWRVVPVRSGSMAPVAPKGSAVLAAPVRADDLRPGDVVLFRAPTAGHPELVHRIHEIVVRNGEKLYRTKGDANAAPDPWLIRMRSATVWRVRQVVPMVGTLVDGVGNPAVRFSALVVATLALVALGLTRLWRRPRPAEVGLDAEVRERARVAGAAATAAVAGTAATASVNRAVAEIEDSTGDLRDAS